jgi:hypothetical protein
MTTNRTAAANALPTLDHLPRHGVTAILAWCGRWPAHCTHHGVVPLAAIGDLHCTIKDVERRLRCCACGHLGGQAMPDWPNKTPPSRARPI